MRASAALLAGLFLLAGCRKAEEPLRVVTSPREAPSAGSPAAPSAGAVAPPPVKFVRPDDAGAHARLAGVLTQLGRLEEAAAAQSRAAELDPAYATPVPASPTP